MAEMTILFIVGKSSFVTIVSDCDNGRHVNRGWGMGEIETISVLKGKCMTSL